MLGKPNNGVSQLFALLFVEYNRGQDPDLAPPDAAGRLWA